MSEILIVGGGLIGLSAAHFLAKAGHQVQVLERDETHTQSCSEGNAGMIVPSHFIPLAAPGVITQGIKWMLNPKSPFSLRPRLSPSLARWIWLFARHSTKQHVQNTQTLIRDLSLASRKLHLQLSQEHHFPLIQKGLLMLCQSEEGLEDEIEVAQQAHQLDLQAEICDPTRLKELEPNTPINAKGGIWWPQDCHLSPTDYIQALRTSITKNKGQLINAKATQITAENNRIKSITTSDGKTHSAQIIILAGGIETIDLTRQINLNLPMQGGKGYSLTLPNPTTTPALCSLLKEGRVAVTPMGPNLRVAGTMEICEKDTSVSKPRVQGIIESFCQFYPQYRPSDFNQLDPWVGLRPCSPDGLPYLGFAPKHNNLIIATGHAMMGLSLAPITGKLITELLDGSPSINLSQLNPARFH